MRNWIKTIQEWRIRMAKKMGSAVQRRTFELPRVELIPVLPETLTESLRDKEIRDILAKLILCSHQRGRPKNTEAEGEVNAA